MWKNSTEYSRAVLHTDSRESESMQTRIKFSFASSCAWTKKIHLANLNMQAQNNMKELNSAPVHCVLKVKLNQLQRKAKRGLINMTEFVLNMITI